MDGIGSKWTNSGNLYVGGSNFGAAGTSVLRIQNSGTVQATATTVLGPGALEFGPDANITGNLTFDGGTVRSVSALGVGTFAIQGTLTLKSNAAFKFELNSSTPAAAKLVANGVSISGATFSFADRGSAYLALGTTFVIIDNTSSSAIGGFFSNLADNSTFTNNGNAYLVSYESGTGNDHSRAGASDLAAILRDGVARIYETRAATSALRNGCGKISRRHSANADFPVAMPPVIPIAGIRSALVKR